MVHYDPSIRLFGSLDNYNTEFTERLHIENAKWAWDATNKQDSALYQMAHWLTRQEKINLHEVTVAARQGALSEDTKKLRRTTRGRISLAKTPSARKVSFTQLAASYGIPGFAVLLRQFVAQMRGHSLRTRAGREEAASVMLPFNQVNVWHLAKFPIPNLQGYEDSDKTTIVRARPSAAELPARFDTVLVEDADRTEEQFSVDGEFIYMLKSSSFS